VLLLVVLQLSIDFGLATCVRAAALIFLSSWADSARINKRFELVRWSASINKRLKPFDWVKDQRINRSFRFARDSSNLLNNQTRSVIELREVSILKSNQRDQSRTAWSLYLEEQTSVSLLQRHSQCDDLLTLIVLPISESILLLVHVQLVSLLQWHLPSMQWPTRSHRPTYQWIWSNVHVQLVSLLQWHLFSMRWPTRSHRPTYQWTGPPTSSRATSEPATMTLSMQWSIFSSFYPPVNRFAYSFMCN